MRIHKQALQEFQNMKKYSERYKRYANFSDALKEVLPDA